MSGPCCHIPCAAPAAFEVTFGMGPDDSTLSCAPHLVETIHSRRGALGAGVVTVVPLVPLAPGALPPASSPTSEELGRLAYQGYGDERGWKTVSGAPMPAWEVQDQGIRKAWEMGAARVAVRVAEALRSGVATALLLLLALCLPALALAQEGTPGGTPVVDYDPLGLGHLLFQAVMGKRWPEVAVILLMAGVVLIRKLGQALRDLLPDDHLLDRFLTFMLTTKAGGWILNFLTAAVGALMAAVAAHEALTLEVCQMAIMVGLAAAGGWEGAKDLAGPLLARWLRLPAPAGAGPTPAPVAPPTSTAETADRLGKLPGGGG